MIDLGILVTLATGVLAAVWAWLGAERDATEQRIRAEDAERREQQWRDVAKTPGVDGEEALRRMERGDG